MNNNDLKQSITFARASRIHAELIFKWLDEPHVKAFWDNSQAHRDDILIFMDGRKEPSDYFGGIITYWVGSVKDDPYCFLLTAPFKADEATPGIWKEHMAKNGRTYTIDFCIGNKAYLGEGLAAPTLKAFTDFFKKHVDHLANTFFIDPDESNLKAKHVYEKAGFKLVGEFVMEKGFFAGQKTLLMIKNMP